MILKTCKFESITFMHFYTDLLNTAFGQNFQLINLIVILIVHIYKDWMMIGELLHGQIIFYEQLIT